MVEVVDDIQHELFRKSLRMTGVSQRVEVTTMGDIPSAGSGLGSSSTVTVGTLHALYTLIGEIVSAERLAREACEIEIEILEETNWNTGPVHRCSWGYAITRISHRWSGFDAENCAG